MLSIIIPAHNEEQYLGATLEALAASLKTLEIDHEIIVINDSSNDRTGEIALAHGVRVITADVHQIAAARNVGAREAKGDMFVFVDADTIVTANVLAAAVAAMRNGAVGGGARATY